MSEKHTLDNFTDYELRTELVRRQKELQRMTIDGTIRAIERNEKVKIGLLITQSNYVKVFNDVLKTLRNADQAFIPCDVYQSDI